MVRLATLLFCATAPLQAQLIQVKTIPLAQGNQFQIFPSANLGMASVSIALEDPVQDPFVNPATGARLETSRFFSSPTVYTVTRGTGGGRSLPLAVLARRANWYGGLALALQQVDPSRPPDQGDIVALPGDIRVAGAAEAIPGPDLRAHGNRFAFGMLGRSIPARNLSVGASVLWNGLHAVDGVDLLYPDSRRIAQSGHSLDLRVGALKEWPGERGARSLEAMLLHNRFAATHNVTYADPFWDPVTQQIQEQARMERNFEHTNTWGLQLDYRMPLPAPGWRIGWLAVANRSSYPKAPNYQLGNMPAFPRYPGRTYAYNLGIGVAEVDGPTRFGVDAIYEPIASYTWADAAAPVVTSAGTIAVGGKTLENRFRFSNVRLRIGLDEVVKGTGKAAAFQLGLILHSIHYRLQQHDHVQLLQRSVRTSWVEWTPTWGVSLRRPDVELRYQGRATKGAGRPQPFFFGGLVPLDVVGESIIGPPPVNSRLGMTDVTTVTHQISLSLPLR
jgi:hypothetical protein